MTTERFLRSEAVTQVVPRRKVCRPSRFERVLEGPGGGVLFFALLALAIVLFFGGSN